MEVSQWGPADPTPKPSLQDSGNGKGACFQGVYDCSQGCSLCVAEGGTTTSSRNLGMRPVTKSVTKIGCVSAAKNACSVHICDVRNGIAWV